MFASELDKIGEGKFHADMYWAHRNARSRKNYKTPKTLTMDVDYVEQTYLRIFQKRVYRKLKFQKPIDENEAIRLKRIWDQERPLRGPDIKPRPLRRYEGITEELLLFPVLPIYLKTNNSTMWRWENEKIFYSSECLAAVYISREDFPDRYQNPGIYTTCERRRLRGKHLFCQKHSHLFAIQHNNNITSLMQHSRNQ